jgi:hypothetical protein
VIPCACDNSSGWRSWGWRRWPCSWRAPAGFIYTFSQVGPDVISTGSGSLNIAALTDGGDINSSSAPGDLFAHFAILLTRNDGEAFQGIVGPASFGPGGEVTPSSVSGDFFGVFYEANALLVPHGYTSGTKLSNTDTWSGQNITSLGLTPGTYTWNWGSAANGNADFFTIQIVPAATGVPEPASLTLFGLGALGLAVAYRRRRSA